MKQSIILMASSVHYELLSDISHRGRDKQTGRQVAEFAGGSVCVVKHRRRLGGCGIMCASLRDLQLSLRCRRRSVISPHTLFDTCWHHPHVWPHRHTLFPVCQKSTHLPKQHTRTANGSAVGDRFLNKPFKSCEAVSSEPWNAPETSLWQFSLSLSAWRWYRVTN